MCCWNPKVAAIFTTVSKYKPIVIQLSHMFPYVHLLALIDKGMIWSEIKSTWGVLAPMPLPCFGQRLKWSNYQILFRLQRLAKQSKSVFLIYSYRVLVIKWNDGAKKRTNWPTNIEENNLIIRFNFVLSLIKCGVPWDPSLLKFDQMYLETPGWESGALCKLDWEECWLSEMLNFYLYLFIFVFVFVCICICICIGLWGTLTVCKSDLDYF